MCSIFIGFIHSYVCVHIDLLYIHKHTFQFDMQVHKLMVKVIDLVTGRDSMLACFNLISTY